MTEPLSRDQLISALAKGMKPRDEWRIGAEHEKFMFAWSDLRRPRLRRVPTASARCWTG
jgi:glutamate--cysteine ligase